MKKVLNVWGEFLLSPESRKVLENDKEGWFGATGLQNLVHVANLGQTDQPRPFHDMFHCDSTAPYHGFKSWDDFFTRQFKEGIRPIAEPDNEDVVVNACESKMYKLARNVRARDRFWIKGQPYSVKDMLALDPLAEAFVGGTIYQAFLSALSYHRWHSPVTGTIKKTMIVDGTYYSEPQYDDFDAKTGAMDAYGEMTSQEYITAMATRAIIYIEADNKKLGLVAFIAVGMVEVSTCDVTVKEGDHITKGDQLG